MSFILGLIIGGAVATGFFGLLLARHTFENTLLDIKDECKRRECYECPLRRADGSCRVESPCTWDIYDEREYYDD